jgi:NAD(P)-dependent dehydrogenase (short-subunit alcohol dehydrogenase family)
MSKILLILGSGANIGAHTAKAFASQGYKVASASRTAPKTPDGSHLHIALDLAKPETVPAVFEKVRKEFGGEVSVVVYNGK